MARLEKSPLRTIAVNTSQAGMKMVGFQEGFSAFDPLSKYEGVDQRTVLMIQEGKKPTKEGGKTVTIAKFTETKDGSSLFPTGDLPKGSSPEGEILYSGPLSAKKIFEIVSQETAQITAPTVVQFGLKGDSLEEEQPLLATLEKEGGMVHYDEGLLGAANRMQSIIDGNFDSGFNLVLEEDGEKYVIPVDIVGSAENIQIPVKKPLISKKPRQAEEHGTPVPVDVDHIASFDTGFVIAQAQGDKDIKTSHSMGLVFELGEGDLGETAFLASLGSNRQKPAGHVWAGVVQGLTGKEINAQDPQRYASGGMLSEEGLYTRAHTLAEPFAVTMANSPYMVGQREKRKELLRKPTTEDS